MPIQQNRITGADGYTYTYDGDGNRVDARSTGTVAGQGDEMTIGKLENKKVNLIFVDPWDLVTHLGSGPFVAKVIRVGQDSSSREMLLLELDAPTSSKGDEYKYFVAGTRHEHSTFDQLFRGATVGVNLTRVPAEKVNVANPFDLSWWHGGGALIADVTLLEAPQANCT